MGKNPGRSPRASMAGIKAILALAGLLATAGCESSYMPDIRAQMPWSCPRHDEKTMLVAELYFGRTEPNGLYVTEIDWQQFLNDTVNSRFPDGLTAIDANGQYWNKKNQAIQREATKILVIAADDNSLTETKISEIIAAYKSRFSQESVMLVERTQCVGFP